MNASKLFFARALVALFAVILMAGMAFGQDITNTGTWTNTGTVIATNFTNSGADAAFANSGGSSSLRIGGVLTTNAASALPANFDVQAGDVQYTKGDVQTITQLVKDAKYANLKASGGAVKTLGGNITVTGTATSDGASTVVSISDKTLTVTAASPIAVANSGAFTFSGGTVDYAGDVDQSVYGTTYNNLITSGATEARLKTAGGNVTVSTALNNSSNNTLDFGTNSFTGTGATITNAATLKSAGAVTLTSGTTVGGTFNYYASTGTQLLADAVYTDLTLSAGSGSDGLKRFRNGTTSVSGTYTAAGANRDYTTNSSTFRYNGTTQSVLAESYHHLTLVGAGLGEVKTAAGNVSVGGDVTNTAGTFNMFTHTLAVTGGKTNTGKVQFAGSNGVVFAGGIVEYNGSTSEVASQAIALGTYANLLFTNNAIKSIAAGTVRTNANLDVNSGVPVTVASDGVLQVDGNLTNAGAITNAGTIQVGP